MTMSAPALDAAGALGVVLAAREGGDVRAAVAVTLSRGVERLNLS
jgi:hypothetical protein